MKPIPVHDQFGHYVGCFTVETLAARLPTSELAGQNGPCPNSPFSPYRSLAHWEKFRSFTKMQLKLDMPPNLDGVGTKWR